MSDANGHARRGTTRRTSYYRFQLYNAFWDRGTAASLRPRDANTWLALYRHANPDRTVCVSAGRLAEMLGTRRDAVVRSIRRLRIAGLLVQKHRGFGPGNPSVYWIRPNRRDTPPDDNTIS